MSIVRLFPIAAVTVFLMANTTFGQDTSSPSDTRYLYRILYRNGPQDEWREATEAGSPVFDEKQAIEVARTVREKFDHGGLSAIELEVHKFKVITRPATPEEQQEHAEALTGVTTAPNVTRMPAHSHLRPANQGRSHNTQEDDAVHPAPSGTETSQSKPSTRSQSEPSASTGAISPSAETDASAKSGVASSEVDKSSKATELTFNDSTPRPEVTTVNRVTINVSSMLPGDTAKEVSTDTALKRVPTLDDLVARLQREVTGESTQEQLAITTPAVATASNLDPNFFDQSGTARRSSRPVALRRIQVIRNGRVVAYSAYDSSGNRINDPQTVSENLTNNTNEGSNSTQATARPEEELVFDEQASRDGKPATLPSKDADLASALQRDRQMLAQMQANLENRQTELDTEAKRLSEERAELEREGKALRSRDEELKSRSARISSTGLEGRTASGTMGLGNASGKRMSVYIEFLSGGRLRARDDKGTYDGDWSQSGDSVTIRASNSSFSGTLIGNSLTGGRNRNDGLRDSWELKVSGESTSATEMRNQIAVERQRLRTQQSAHEQRQQSHQQAQQHLQSDRVSLQAEQSRYEDAFAMHRQQTLEFNSRKGP